jgi:hypothetical protein
MFTAIQLTGNLTTAPELQYLAKWLCHESRPPRASATGLPGVASSPYAASSRCPPPGWRERCPTTRP